MFILLSDILLELLLQIALFNDLQEFERGHFRGGVILNDVVIFSDLAATVTKSSANKARPITFKSPTANFLAATFC